MIAIIAQLSISIKIFNKIQKLLRFNNKTICNRSEKMLRFIERSHRRQNF